jgi:glycosyltransferase involved in cell wall biosynthesis
MAYKYKFTVFTPTYNRAHTIHRVYQSLKAQTYRDFEWIVIDDGSNDQTSTLVSTWCKDSNFSIVYKYQNNSGKHVAFNCAVKIAQGELFLPVDSDDEFLPNALDEMIKWWEDIPEKKRVDFTGIVTLCKYENGKLCSAQFPEHPYDTNALDLKYKVKVSGAKWGFHRTDILRRYPFPNDPHVRFIPESIVWGKIARKYKIRCINVPILIVYQDSGNQLTKSIPREKARVGKYFLQLINRDFDYARYDPKAFFILATLYTRYSLHNRDRHFMSFSRFSCIGAYLLILVTLLPGLLSYFIDLIKK